MNEVLLAHAKGKVVITTAQRRALETLVRAYTTPQHIAQRARIVLMSESGLQNVQQAAELGIDAQRIRRLAAALGRGATRDHGFRSRRW